MNDSTFKILLKNLANIQITILDLETNFLTKVAIDYIISFTKYNSNIKKIFLKNNPIEF